MKYNKDKKKFLLKVVELCPLGLPDRKLCYKNSVDMQKCLRKISLCHWWNVIIIYNIYLYSYCVK